MNYPSLALCFLIFLTVNSSYGQDLNGVDKEIQTTDSIYTIVDIMPDPGYDLGSYFSKNLHYSKAASEARMEGTVSVSMLVQSNGAVSELKVIKGLGYGLDQEALRLIKEMPRWKPGRRGGEAVPVRMTQPVPFKLADLMRK